MKTMLRLARAPFVIGLVYAVFFYEGAREAWKKQRLGARYEGPAEE